jgi:serine/threonine-protein kinase RsbW
VNAPDVDPAPELPAHVIRLRHEAVSVGVARRRVRSALVTDGVPEPALDDVEMVVSELLGNSVRHARPIAGGVLLLGWRAGGGQVHLRVTDGGSAHRVEAAEGGPMSESGRGLHIVERLASAWGVIDHAGGLRTVWATLPSLQRAGGSPSGPVLRLVR